jgi:four helix bundle protein
MMKEIRRSKSEIRKKTECRKPNAESENNLTCEHSRNVMNDSELFFDHDSTGAEEIFWGLAAANDATLHDGPPPRIPIRDLCERTAQFGEEVIRFAKKIPQNAVSNRLISQLVGAGTSVGANEADDAVSKKDFKKCIGTCRKESKETKYWLRMVATAEPNLKNGARVLWQEAKELNLIFGSIWRKP